MFVNNDNIECRLFFVVYKFGFVCYDMKKRKYYVFLKGLDNFVFLYEKFGLIIYFFDLRNMDDY